MNMKHIKITIKGNTPLLIHAFTDTRQIAATEGGVIKKTGDRGTPREQADEALYKDEQGRAIMPQPNILRCFIDAGKYFQYDGKSKVTTVKSSVIPSCVDIEGTHSLIKFKEPWEVDSRPVQMPSTGGRILRYRAKFQDWSLSFAMNIDQDIMSEKFVRQIVDAAGTRVGIGDFRPDRKGCFGKFSVTSWK